VPGPLTGVDGLLLVAPGCGVAGAAVGAGLVRVAYRLSVPAGALPRTTCHRCGEPAASWVSPRSCPSCRARLGPPVWMTAAACSVAWAGIGWRFGPAPELLPYLLLAGLGVLLAAVDLACLRLPDALVKPGFVAGAAVFCGLAAGLPAWPDLLRAGFAAGVLAGGYLVLAVLPGGALGYGDVKLAGLLGLFLGWLGWGEVLAGALLPFLINGVVAVGLLAARRVTRRTLVPFGPAMLLGAWLAVVALPALR
jgi:leader peptidase (prepilin peptidase)/N-methyltransferase